MVERGDDSQALRFAGEHGEVLPAQIVDRSEMILPPAARTSSSGAPAVAVDRLLAAAPDIAKLLRGGKVMRVIGGPSGPLWEVSGGVLGTVRADGKIVGHLRFEGPPKNVRTVAAPAAAFQIASAVTLQYYLNVITSQLEEIRYGIEAIKDWLKANELAELETSERDCVELAAHLAVDSELRSDDWVRLNDALNCGRRRFAAARERLAIFGRKVESAVTEDGDILDRSNLKSALSDGTSDAVGAFNVMLRAAALRMRALAIRAAGEASSDPRRIATTHAVALHEVDILRGEIVAASEALFALNIRRSALEREYTLKPGKWGAQPRTELERYRRATKPLRGVLRRPIDDIFPAIVEGDPWVAEVFVNPTGELETRIEPLTLEPDYDDT